MKIDISVKGPWYATLWFVLPTSALLIAGLVFYIQTRKVCIIREKELQLTAQVFKEEALRSQLNPHFIFNALNSIQNYIAKNEGKEAERYLVKFARLIRTFLDHSKSNSLSLAKELSLVRDYLDLE